MSICASEEAKMLSKGCAPTAFPKGCSECGAALHFVLESEGYKLCAGHCCAVAFIERERQIQGAVDDALRLIEHECMKIPVEEMEVRVRSKIAINEDKTPSFWPYIEEAVADAHEAVERDNSPSKGIDSSFFPFDAKAYETFVAEEQEAEPIDFDLYFSS